jgi:hypothetical protein
MTDKPTKAQLRLLKWLLELERVRLAQMAGLRAPVTSDMVTFRGGDLIDYYAEVRKQDDPEGKRPNSYGRGGYASHGWRRAGGTALKNLADRGFMDMVGFSIGVPEYVLTDKGRAAAQS